MRLSTRGFKCTCRACQNTELVQKLDRANELDHRIMALGSVGKMDAAIRVGEAPA